MKKLCLLEIIRIQQQQLINWKPKLSEACFDSLLKEVHQQNSKLTPASDGREVWRGSDMDNFIGNWRSGE